MKPRTVPHFLRRLAIVPLLLAACAGQQTRPADDPRTGTAPLALALPLFPNGPLHSLERDRGNVVLLDVWATWCEPCKDALPAYEDFAERFGARGFRVYAITVDEDPNHVRAFIEQSKLSLPVLVDRNAEVSERVLKVSMMPTSFLLDRQGIVRFVHEGFSQRELARKEEEIEKLLAEPAAAAAPPSVPPVMR